MTRSNDVNLFFFLLFHLTFPESSGKLSQHKYLFIFAHFRFFAAFRLFTCSRKQFLWEKSETDGAWKVDAIKTAHQKRERERKKVEKCGVENDFFFEGFFTMCRHHREAGCCVCLMENIQIKSFIYDTFNLNWDFEASHLNFVPICEIFLFSKICPKKGIRNEREKNLFFIIWSCCEIFFFERR